MRVARVSEFGVSDVPGLIRPGALRPVVDESHQLFAARRVHGDHRGRRATATVVLLHGA